MYNPRECEDHHQHCVWCDSVEDLTGLIGIHTNQCSGCGNPVFPVAFKGLPVGCVFISSNGGKWVKSEPTAVVCVEDDSAFRTGETIEWEGDEPVYPF